MQRHDAPMTGFLRALHVLGENPGGLLPEEFYRLMWPGKDSTGGSSKGGPSDSQCAANWLLGRVAAKYARSVRRYGYLDETVPYKSRGKWFITVEGLSVLRLLRK